MAVEWAQVRLGDAMTLQRGFDLPSQDRRPGNVPIVSSSGVAAFHSVAGVRGPGVVTGRYGTIGQVFFVKEDYWPLNTTLWVKDFHGNDPHFASYLLRTIDFWSCSDKSSVPGVNRNDLHRLPVLLPPLAEQKAIAAVLGALDDKIELNRRMNTTLDAMTRALFQSWFVDFDPVHARLDGRVKDVPDARSADLFPAVFQHSEIGQTPKGWTVGRIGDLAAIDRAPITPGDFPEENFDHFSLPAFDNGRTPNLEHGSSIMSNKFTVAPNSVLVSRLNPHIPRVWLPDLHPSRRSVCSTEFIVACPKPGVSREYLFSLFTSSAFTSIYGTLVTGTTGSHQRIRPESVLDMKVVVPSVRLIRAFTDIAKPILDRINRNTEQSGTLASLRDTLLPRLLSGELRIADMVNTNPVPR